MPGSTASAADDATAAAQDAVPATAPARLPTDSDPHLDPPTVASRVHFRPAMSGLPMDGMWKCDPIFADFNADGHMDIAAIVRLGDGPHVWLGNGNGEWTESSSGLDPNDNSCGGGMQAIDINKDGHLDLAVADHCNGVFIYVGNGKGEWLMTTRALHPNIVVEHEDEVSMYTGAEDIGAGDVNGDGHIDLVVASSDNAGINVYFGDGTTINWEHQETPALPRNGWTNRLLLDDIDNDGDLDIVAAVNAGPRVFKNSDGKGDWIPYSGGLPTPLVQGLFHGIAVGDIDEDGLTDIAVANWIDGPDVFRQHPAGGWEPIEVGFDRMTGGAQGLALGDMNNDGHVDIAVTGRLDREGRGCVRGLFALLGDGTGAFEWQQECGLPNFGLAGCAGVAIGDINGDGWGDVALGTGLKNETGPRREPTIPQRLVLFSAHEPSAPDAAGANAQVTP
jgi:hypothetical protein